MNFCLYNNDVLIGCLVTVNRLSLSNFFIIDCSYSFNYFKIGNMNPESFHVYDKCVGSFKSPDQTLRD